MYPELHKVTKIPEQLKQTLERKELAAQKAMNAEALIWLPFFTHIIKINGLISFKLQTN